MVAKQPMEPPSRGGYLLARKGLAVGFGTWGSEAFGCSTLAGRAADTAGHRPVGMDQGLAGKGWAQDKHLLGLAGSDRQASRAAGVPRRRVGSTARQPGPGAPARV